MILHRSLRVLLPLMVLAGFGYAAWLIKNTPPEISKRSNLSPEVTVETNSVKTVSFAINLPSYGRVQPRTQSNLVAQVSGQIVEISDHFRDGGYVEAGEVLVRIDPVDYKVQVDIAKGQVVEAELALEEEKARGRQARKDWEKIGGLDSASDLALRLPQLRAAEARVTTAKARLTQAQVNLRRTEVRAPYAGRILNTHVDIGAVIGPQVLLAELYATDYAEVRLPVKSADLAYIQLPEASERGDPELYPSVTFTNNLATPPQLWQGQIVRTEGAIDPDSQQLYVIAQIDNPFNVRGNSNAMISSDVTEGIRNDRRQPLKIGQYLPASIEGKYLSDIIIVPDSAIYQGSYVYLVKNDVLIRRAVTLGFQGETESVVISGIEAGDELVLTSLGQVASGTAVKRVVPLIGNTAGRPEKSGEAVTP